MAKDCQCLFDVARHEQVDLMFDIIPMAVDTKILGTCPVVGDCVVFSEGIE
jgi:hypothetical protein